jgi:PKHD-type hydroxylase
VAGSGTIGIARAAGAVHEPIMALVIDNVLDQQALDVVRSQLAAARWADGAATAGHQALGAKHNQQLAEGDDTARALQTRVAAALADSPLFQAAALPRRMTTPMFNRYAEGNSYGAHIDNAMRRMAGGEWLRTDMSATLCLTDPADYDGGELVIENGSISQSHKLAAGTLLLYPATSRHRVNPVTRGERWACIFWVQSLVADAARRAILFDIDLAIQSLRPRVGAQDTALIALTGAYHNLLRQWAAP